MLIVHAQVHIWGPETPERRWPPGGWVMGRALCDWLGWKAPG